MFRTVSLSFFQFTGGGGYGGHWPPHACYAGIDQPCPLRAAPRVRQALTYARAVVSGGCGSPPAACPLQIS